MSGILSEETEREIKDIVKECTSEAIEEIKQELREFPYKKKADLKRKLKINEAYYQKLIIAGLQEVQLEPTDKTIWISEPALVKLMDQLAE